MWEVIVYFFHQFICWLGKNQKSSGRFKEERNFLFVPAIEPRFLGLLTRSLLTVLDEMFRPPPFPHNFPFILHLS
jgi:hypothetical protein